MEDPPPTISLCRLFPEIVSGIRERAGWEIFKEVWWFWFGFFFVTNVYLLKMKVFVGKGLF